jgi:multimeric flavodoxin WrbA
LKAIAVMGSARKYGNSAKLARTVMNGAAEADVETSEFFLSEMIYDGCIGCDACKRTDHCVVIDDVIKVLNAIYEADIVILASPIYWFDITGQMKCCLDRFYALLDKEYKTRLAPGKKGVWIFTQESKDANLYKDVGERYTKALDSLGFSEKYVLWATGVHLPGEIQNQKDVLEQAHELGKKLANV